MNNEILKLNNITKTYLSHREKKVIFKNLNFSVSRGDRIGVVGANGSGKSTFIKIIVRQIKIDNGEIMSKFDNKELVYLPQDYRNSLFPWLSISSNISLLLNTNESYTNNLKLTNEQENEIQILLKNLHLNINLEKYPYQLSGGEQQAILLIYAVLKKPKILIVDEPFSAIDYHKRELFESFFSSWVEKNKITTIMVSHDLGEAVYFASKVLILSKNNEGIRSEIGIDFSFPRLQELKYQENFRNIILHIKNNFE